MSKPLIYLVVLPVFVACGTTAHDTHDGPLATTRSSMHGATEATGHGPALSAEVVVDPASISIPTVFEVPEGRGRGQGAQTAFDGTNYVAAWLEARTDSDALFFSRVTEQGVVLNPHNVLISRPPPPAPTAYVGELQTHISRFRLAASSAGTLVAWVEESAGTDGADVYVARVSVDGALVDATPLRISTPVSYVPTDYGNAQLAAPFVVAADARGFRVAVLEAATGGVVQFVSYRIRPTTDTAANAVVSRTAITGPLSALPNVPLDFYGWDASLVGDETSALLAWNSGVDSAPFGYQTNLVAFTDGMPTTAPIRTFPGSLRGPLMWLPNRTSGLVIDADRDRSKTFYTFDATGTDLAAPGTANVYTWYGFMVPDGDRWAVSVSGGGDRFIEVYSRQGAKLSSAAIPMDPFDVRSSWSGFGYYGLSVGTTTYLDTSERAHARLAYKSTIETVALPQLGRSANRQSEPSIATDGDGYVMAWRDDRLANDAWVAGGGPAVYAARFDADGHATTPAVRLSRGILQNRSNFTGLNDSTDRPEVQVIFDGTKFFAVWSEVDPSAPIPQYQTPAMNLVGVVLPRTGPLEIESYVPIAPSSGPEVSVTSDGVQRIVAFTSAVDSASTIMGARVAIADNRVLDPEPFPISARSTTAGYTQETQLTPTMAFDGQRTLVAWSGGTDLTRQIFGRWIPRGEAAIDSPFVLDSSALFAHHPRLASDRNHGFLLTWQTLVTSRGDSDLWGKFIPTVGELPPNSAAFAISTEPGDQRSQAIAVANDHANYLITWSDNRSGTYSIYGAWVATDEARVRDPKGVLFSSGPYDHFAPSAAAIDADRGAVAYHVFDSSSTTNAFRLRLRTFSSGLVSSATCTSNDQCATRFCVAGYCCDKPCDGECGVCNAIPGTCSPVSAGAACGRRGAYSCDGKSTSCVESCAADTDCRAGDYCSANECVPREVRCLDDRTALTHDGELPCGRFKCRGAACLSSCGSVDDCNDGLVCDERGQCISPPGFTNDAGCAVVPWERRDTRVVLPLGAVFSLSLLLSLRRRGQRNGGAR